MTLLKEAPVLPRSLALEFVQAATLAPSADNHQPWKFSIQEDRILVHEDQERRLPSDVRSMFSLLALGAAVENLSIAARQRGYTPDIRPFPPGGAVAEMTFSSGGEPDGLYPFLESRKTSRKPYAFRSPSAGTLSSLEDETRFFPGTRLEWLGDPVSIFRLTRLVAATDRIRLEHQPFHEELHRMLRHSEEEALRTRDGLDLRTLEVPPGTGPLLRFLTPWRRAKTLYRAGMGRALTLPGAVTLLRSGAVGALSLAEATPGALLSGGRAFERVWLAADRVGLSFQPVGSLPLFLAKQKEDGATDLSASHRRILQRVQDRLVRLLPSLGSRFLLMLFRVGYASSPQVRSLRRQVQEVVQREIPNPNSQ